MAMNIIRTGTELSRNYDSDPVRGDLYAHVLEDLAELTAAKNDDLSQITLFDVEQIFAKYALPTSHIAQILESLKRG